MTVVLREARRFFAVAEAFCALSRDGRGSVYVLGVLSLLALVGALPGLLPMFDRQVSSTACFPVQPPES